MRDRPFRVLVVDDDPNVSDVVTRYLEREGFVVEAVRDGRRALERALAGSPDLVVLDLMLPGLSGSEVCRRLRLATRVPVIMLTARGEEGERVAGLELGADDYVTKPFSPRELTSRVKAVLRRAVADPTAAAETPLHLDAGRLVLDVATRQARLDGEIVALTVKEFDLLAFLMRHPRRAFRRDELLEEVWGYAYGDTSTVTVHVRRLREKIEDDPSNPMLVGTVWGVGYRFEGGDDGPETTAAPMRPAVVAAMPVVDAVVLTLLGLVVSGLVAACGWLLLWRWPRAPLRTQIVVVSLVATMATTGSVLLASRAMFVSSHDAAAVLVVVAATGLAGVVAGIALARRVARSSARLGEASMAIGDEGFAAPTVATAELDQLARQLEETSSRLTRAREREHALDRSRRELVAWASHDLRTPLAGIRAMVEALEDEVVADPVAVASYHRSIRLETDRLARLVDDLFELSRIEAGALRICPEAVSLRDLASDAVASMMPAATAKGVRIHGRTEATALVEGSTAELGRVIRNLLDNAVRWTPAGGEVTVEIGEDPTFGFLSIADECGGIPEGVLARVFEPAYRGDAARTPSSSGSGLGLAIARGLVEAQAGRIEVSNANGGCRFTVRLPRPS